MKSQNQLKTKSARKIISSKNLNHLAAEESNNWSFNLKSNANPKLTSPQENSVKSELKNNSTSLPKWKISDDKNQNLKNKSFEIQRKGSKKLLFDSAKKISRYELNNNFDDQFYDNFLKKMKKESNEDIRKKSNDKNAIRTTIKKFENTKKKKKELLNEKSRKTLQIPVPNRMIIFDDKLKSNNSDKFPSQEKKNNEETLIIKNELNERKCVNLETGSFLPDEKRISKNILINYFEKEINGGTLSKSFNEKFVKSDKLIRLERKSVTNKDKNIKLIRESLKFGDEIKENDQIISIQENEKKIQKPKKLKKFCCFPWFYN